MDGKRLLRLPEAADELEVALNTLKGYISSGALQVVRLGPKTQRVRTADLERFITDRLSRGA